MSDSDVEMKRIPPMKPKRKLPGSPTEDLLLKPQEKKVTTKAMIHEALTELKTRKGVSVQAIKKFMEDKYYVETDKVKFLIKKTLKTGVEDGSIIQLKGIGASGSFKLAAVKVKPKKKPKSKKEEPKKEKSTEEKSKEKPMKEKKKKKEKNMKEEKEEKNERKEKNMKEEKEEKNERKEKKVKTVKEKAIEKIRTSMKVKMDVKDNEKKIENPKHKKAKSKEKAKAKTAATPSKERKKKAGMMKRKSIGSLIRPPKMKPKSKA